MWFAYDQFYWVLTWTPVTPRVAWPSWALFQMLPMALASLGPAH